jgi:hypothetical protein
LATGRRTRIGKPEFGATVFLFAAGNKLFSIETDGSLYHINPANGTWGRIGAAEVWEGTRAGVILKGRLFTVEANGHLYVTDLGTGKWKPIGKPEFGDTVHMFAGKGRVYTIEKSGSLYGVSVQ